MIILARMENNGLRETGKIVQRGRNLFPEYENYAVPHALLFANKEHAGDLQRAERFAAREGYTVYTGFPKGTRVAQAIEQAKKWISEV